MFFYVFACLIPSSALYTDSDGTQDTGYFQEPWEETVEQPIDESECTDISNTDQDGDGVSQNEGDCDDNNPDISPNLDENPYDGLDNDCDASTPDDDLDQDGYPISSDCDDLNDEIHPNVEDYICDGIDNNCDGQIDEQAQPDMAEPFDINTPLYLGDLSSLGDTVSSNHFLFPTGDEDGFLFWFEDDSLDCVIFVTEDPDHFTCTVQAPQSVDIEVEVLWQQEGTSTFVLHESQAVTAGTTATFEGGSGDCGMEEGGTYQLNIHSIGASSCLEQYTLTCTKDGD